MEMRGLEILNTKIDHLKTVDSKPTLIENHLFRVQRMIVFSGEGFVFLRRRGGSRHMVNPS